MDIASSLCKHASHKQLRRLSAAVGLQADEEGSLAALLALPKPRVRDAVKSVLKNSKEAAALWGTIEAWMDNGPPVEALEEPEDASPPPSSGEDREGEGGTDASAGGRPAPGAAAPNACVECGARTPYVFAILKCRLCEPCEKKHTRYTLVSVGVAKGIHGLTDADLKVMRGHGKGTNRVFLRTDVEAYSADRYRTSRGAVEALRANASKEWRESSFSMDRKGYTHKWKQWNTHTYQHKQSAKKNDLMAREMVEEVSCMDLSALVYVD